MLRKLPLRIPRSGDLLLSLALPDARPDTPDLSRLVFEIYIIYAPVALELNLRLCYLSCCDLLDYG